MDLRVNFLPTRWFEATLPLFCCIFPVLGDVVYFFVGGWGGWIFLCLASYSFFLRRQCYVSDRKNALFAATGKLMEIGIGGFLLPGTKVLWNEQILFKLVLDHLLFFRSVRQVLLAWCRELQLQVSPRNQSAPNFSVSELIAIYFPDRWPGQTTLPRTTSSRSLQAATQRPARWAESSTPNCSLWSRWPAPSIMVALRVVVPKVGRVGRRTVNVTSHQEGLLDSLLPHLVQQKGIFKVRSRTYSWYKLVLVFSEKCKSIWAPSQ